MKFLSQEEITALQVAEAQSNKKPKKTDSPTLYLNLYSQGSNRVKRTLGKENQPTDPRNARCGTKKTPRQTIS